MVETAQGAADQEANALVEAGDETANNTWPHGKPNPNMPDRPSHTGAANDTNGTNGTANATGPMPVISDGDMDKITGAALPGKQPEAHCTDATLSRCSTTVLPRHGRSTPPTLAPHPDHGPWHQTPSP